MTNKRTIVISGVNLVDGGPLSVYKDFLNAIVEGKFYEDYRIIALVGDEKLFSEYVGVVELLEFPRSKSSWLLRLYYEFIYFKKFSKKEDVDIWISMHDITPNVRAKKRYVYCHNPSPFNEMKIKDAKYGLKYYLFSKFYKYLYAINIHKNTAVIVQQDWMRKEFARMYRIDEKDIIVARPSMPSLFNIVDARAAGETVFVCPSFPRFFKNFQVVCEAASILDKNGVSNFKVYITCDRNDNRYAEELVSNYKDCSNINFCGLLTRDELFELYGKSDCLLFMSKLETWGVPITEFKATDRSIIVSDLPYAHETVGTYSHVAFVNPDDVIELSNRMLDVINNGIIDNKVYMKNVLSPFADNWNDLLSLIIKEF